MKQISAIGLILVLLSVWVCGSSARPVSQAASKEEPKKKALQDDQAKKVEDTNIQPVPKTEEQSGPIGVFADIEAGWKNERAQQILLHYGKGKVAISIEGSGPSGGKFSRNQSYYLLKDLFKYTITERFEFVQYRNVSDGQNKVYAVAERSYKRNDDGRLFKDKIYVSLHLEEDRWVISEIKSIR
jgi:hypothetical protein